MEKVQNTIYWNLFEAAQGLGGLNDLDYLSESERNRKEGFRFEKRRKEWLTGRIAAKKLLIGSDAGYLQFNPADFSIENEPEGAPYIVLNGQKLETSLTISHRDQMAFCALTSGCCGSIGADVEKIEPREPVFVEDYFTNVEQRIIRESRWSNTDISITLIWSAKEAVLKALHKGLRLDTRAVEISSIDEAKGDWGRFIAHSQYIKGENCLGWWRVKGDYVLTMALLQTSTEPLKNEDIHLVQIF